MKSTILKRVLCLFSVFLMTFFIASCKDKEEEYVENPYFLDTSDNDYNSFATQFGTLKHEVYTYYESTYSDLSFSFPFDYQWQQGYVPIPRQTYYTKAEIAVNDHLIDERTLFLGSSLKAAFDNDILVYTFIDDYENCVENTLCGNDDTDNYFHYSAHEEQVYLAYRVNVSSSIYEYMFYLTKDANQKIHFEFLYSITDPETNEVENVQYALYDEGVKETSMTYDGEVTIGYYDIQTNERIEMSHWGGDYCKIIYYDPTLDTEFLSYIDESHQHVNTRLKQFEQNHIKLDTNQELSRIFIRLNQIEGWNRLRVEGISEPYPATLYLDEIPFDDMLNVVYSKITGNVMIKIENIPYSAPASEDLISLDRYGLDSGYNYTIIDTLFDGFIADTEEILDRFDLNQSNENFVQKFIDTTGIEVVFE